MFRFIRYQEASRIIVVTKSNGNATNVHAILHNFINKFDDEMPSETCQNVVLEVLMVMSMKMAVSCLLSSGLCSL